MSSMPGLRLDSAQVSGSSKILLGTVLILKKSHIFQCVFYADRDMLLGILKCLTLCLSFSLLMPKCQMHITVDYLITVRRLRIPVLNRGVSASIENQVTRQVNY